MHKSKKQPRTNLKQINRIKCAKKSLSGGRFELPTQGFSVLCSNQLSYPDKKNSRNSKISLLLVLLLATHHKSKKKHLLCLRR